MLDVKALQKEYVSLTKDIRWMEQELSKKKIQFTALHNAIVAFGGVPERVPLPIEGGGDRETEAESQRPSTRIVSLPEAIREAIPPAGKKFVIDDIAKVIEARFPALDRQKLAGSLWRLSVEGFIKQLEKGTRGTPAQYMRV